MEYDNLNPKFTLKHKGSAIDETIMKIKIEEYPNYQISRPIRLQQLRQHSFDSETEKQTSETD